MNRAIALRTLTLLLALMAQGCFITEAPDPSHLPPSDASVDASDDGG